MRYLALAGGLALAACAPGSPECLNARTALAVVQATVAAYPADKVPANLVAALAAASAGVTAACTVQP